MNVASVRVVVVAFGEKVGGGLVPLYSLGPASLAPRQQTEGTGRIAYQEELVYLSVWRHFTSAWIYYMHMYPARFIFFINMLTNKYRPYRTQTWIKVIT